MWAKIFPEGLQRLEAVLVARGGQFFAGGPLDHQDHDPGNSFTWAELHLLQLVDTATNASKNDKVSPLSVYRQ